MTPSRDSLCAMLAAFAPPLQRYARTLTLSEDAASDLVQDTFERVLRRLDKFSVPEGATLETALRRWCFTVMHNLQMDAIRRNKRRRETSIEAMPDGWAVPVAAQQDDGIAYSDAVTAIHSLDPHDLAVVEKVAIDGLDHEQAAIVLGVAVGTVKSRIFRARERLANRLNAEGYAICRSTVRTA